ncbi:MAG: helix-turn-helix domain-containing protein [Flavobacteriaceae bacterium]
MDQLVNRIRLKKITAQIVEMFKGNFSLRIERTDLKDDLEALAAAINFLSEEIHKSILRHSFKDPDNIFGLTAQLYFILDRSSRIVKANKSAHKFLDFTQGDITGNSFNTLLSKESQKTWKDMVGKPNGSSEGETCIRLSFLTKTGLVLPAECKVVHFGKDGILRDNILVTSCHILPSKKRPARSPLEKYDPLSQIAHQKSQSPNCYKHILYSSDIIYIRAAREYITDHLQSPMPLIEIAHIVGTNEYKLKRGFKELYGLTVFQYIKDQRLRKARLLVLYTNKSIRSIAKMVGFKKGNHLSREFKKRFHHSPTDLRTLGIDPKDFFNTLA